VAHEVKNPLTVILMGVEYLNRHLVAGDDVRDVLRDMDEAVTRANSVVRGLLDFSAPSALELEAVAIPDVIDKAMALVKHEFARARVVVESDLAPDLPPLQLDRAKIEQVFVNLFLNAVQAMPQGGTIRVRSRPAAAAHVDDGAWHDTLAEGAVRPAAVVEVVDTGCGIPPDKLDRVFDPFFTTKRSGEGTGLGLTVIQKIVEMHGATIELANEPAGGLRVTLAFAPMEAGNARPV
jgi:signal transduction histidine kinase